MNTISLCMIVKNEEQTLKKCLNSVKTLVDEIIIVDTGSMDRTKKVAAEFTDKIYNFEWVDDFSAARNYSFSQAIMDYILWLDADDILLPDDIIKFRKLKENLSYDTDVVMLKYNSGFDNEGNVIFSYFRERLVKRAAGFKWKEPVHEYIETYGKSIKGECCITHTKKPKIQDTRNLHIYENLLKSGNKLSSRGIYYYARELKDAERYKDAVQYFDSFLKSANCWIEDNIEACCGIFECLVSLNDSNTGLKYLFKSFEYDIPRPKVCCLLGQYFKKRELYSQAIYWFELALTLKNFDTLGFCQEDYNGYIPCMELSLCYYNIGNNSKALEFYNMATAFKSVQLFIHETESLMPEGDKRHQS